MFVEWKIRVATSQNEPELYCQPTIGKVQYLNKGRIFKKKCKLNLEMGQMSNNFPRNIPSILNTSFNISFSGIGQGHYSFY